MRLFIVRHGETEENISGVVQGHLPGKLSKNGLKQIELLALRLKDEKFDYVFTSDLERAFETTKAIMKFHKNVPIENKLLRERFFGDFQGKSLRDLGVDGEGLRKLIENNESCEAIEQVIQRCAQFLKELERLESSSNVLIVSHAGIGRGIISLLIGEKDLTKIERLKNTSLSIFDYQEGKVNEVCFNCVKHLN